MKNLHCDLSQASQYSHEVLTKIKGNNGHKNSIKCSLLYSVVYAFILFQCRISVPFALLRESMDAYYR